MTTPDKDTVPASDASANPHTIPHRPLTPAAERALAEAAERRKAAEQAAASRQTEVGGRDGPEPTRYGDWEKGGIVSDF
jgi:hypothetical protein